MTGSASAVKSSSGGRSQRSRAAILQASVRVVGRDGVVGASLSTIAREAGTSKAALLYHFDSRENLLRAMGVLALAHFQEVVFEAAQAAERREDKVQAVLEALFHPERRELLAAVREVAGLGVRHRETGTEVIEVFDQLARTVCLMLGDLFDGQFETARVLVITVFGHLEMWLCSFDGDPARYMDGAALAVRAIAAAHLPPEVSASPPA